MTVHAEPRRETVNRLGLWLFFCSEFFLFAALFAARFYLAGPYHAKVNQPLGLAITLVLLVSGFTAYRAEAGIRRGDRSAFLRNLLVTILLGLVFLAGVGVEWATAEFAPSSIFGTAFFTMTGVHASHVLSGVVAFALAYRLGLRGHFSAERHWGVEALVKYWYLIDVVWVFFFPVLYLVRA